MRRRFWPTVALIHCRRSFFPPWIWSASFESTAFRSGGGVASFALRRSMVTASRSSVAGFSR
jgi:hypothetical protein